MAGFFTQGVLLLAAISTAYGLVCYDCDSSSSSLCSYGFASVFHSTKDCNEGNNIIGGIIPKQCVKLVAMNDKGEQYVARGCMPHLGGACSAIAKTLSFFTQVDGIKDMDCFPCDGDKCNSAQKYTGITVLAVVLAAVAFMF